MPTASIQRHVYKRNTGTTLTQKRLQQNKKDQNSVTKNENSVFPFLGIQRTYSNLSLSSLSLSQNSNDDSSIGSSICSWEQKVLSFRGNFSAWGKNELFFGGAEENEEVVELDKRDQEKDDIGDILNEYLDCQEPGSLKRCSWITKASDEAYVSFHDECWGVPIYNDNRLFELLALSGLLIDYNWTEILKSKEIYREAFANFDYNVVARMEEKDIEDIISNKELKLAECRVRAIIENAKCIAREFGSFSGYIWGHVNHKPVIGKYKHPRSVPLRTPKSEFISKDLIRRGFRLVGPVIIYSFMQATGMVIDHLVNCYRFNECVKLAERSWGMTNVAV
ncbi:GMP synthase [glutamine-hydrolyzing] [Carex littledalei]|uniref:GMP synthase [glutamine-hydrolyzing] n=1 Tax=Carex littledalei TaxID=544730 RepID=A0A833R4B5_9POAL|nr:GMP synthase [glutamine-hydrolyzing] [Carex littledalei]